MIDTEIHELRMAVRSLNQLVDKQRRLIHQLTDVAGDPCGDPECPVCLETARRLRVIEGERK